MRILFDKFRVYPVGVDSGPVDFTELASIVAIIGRSAYIGRWRGFDPADLLPDACGLYDRVTKGNSGEILGSGDIAGETGEYRWIHNINPDEDHIHLQLSYNPIVQVVSRFSGAMVFERSASPVSAGIDFYPTPTMPAWATGDPARSG